MSNNRIFGTTIIPQRLRFLASEYHRHSGDTHTEAHMLYRVSRNQDGSGGVEHLLTRFRNRAGKAWSALLLVEENENGAYLVEEFSCERKREADMVEMWKQREEGGA